MADMSAVAHNYVIVARQLAAQHSYHKAYDMYMCAFDKQPRIRQKYRNEFRSLLVKMSDALEVIDNKADIFTKFERAMFLFPNSVDLLNDMGRFLYRYGYFREALCHFEKALNIDNSYVSIEKNLNNAKSFLFPRSQFRILNDKIRNEAYRRALRSCVTSGADSVLDIDTGTGLLALYANECHPLATTACESSPTIAKLAECVIDENNAHDVVIVSQPSVILNNGDVYGSRSVLITDMIDAGLFGEYILQSLAHAWENLLTKDSRVIPGKADYYVAGVTCKELNKKYKLDQDMKNLLKVSNSNVHTTTYFGEKYYSEDVHMYENLKYVTEPQHLFTVDFNNYSDVLEKLNRQEPYYANLTATEDSEISLIVGWFDLHLTEDIMITNDPRSEEKATAWQQAVFFDVITRRLQKNDTMQVPFITYNGRMATLQTQSTAISRISPEALAFLNDVEYTNMIIRSIGTVCVHLGQFVDVSEVDMVDLSPFPLFGVLMMRRGANSLICHAKTLEEANFFRVVFKANGIPEDKVTIMVSENWTHEQFKNKTFHVIFSNVIDLNGDIDVRKKQIIQHLKNSHLVRNGLCLPATVTVMAQLVSSHWLEINNRVLDENVDYKLANHVNRYQVSQATYVDIARLDYKPLSEVFSMKYGSKMKSDVIKVRITEDGECNAVLCWYKVQVLEGCHEIHTHRTNSFVESMAFMTNPDMKVFYDDEIDVLRCVDPDGSFKFIVDIEPY